jgi:hypothetical protein
VAGITFGTAGDNDVAIGIARNSSGAGLDFFLRFFRFDFFDLVVFSAFAAGISWLTAAVIGR